MSAVILLITAIAVPSYLAAKRSGANSSAASSVDGYNKAVQSYVGEWNVIPASAASMGGAEAAPSPTCSLGQEISSNDSGLLSGAGINRSGYIFTMATSLNGGTAPSGLGGCPGMNTYDIVAFPSNPGTSGSAAYCADSVGEWEIAPEAAGATLVVATGISCATDGFTERLGT